MYFRSSEGGPRDAIGKTMPIRHAERRRREIMAEIAKIGICLPGSLVTRSTRCGTPSCRCHTEPDRLHGPYVSWTRKVGAKTVTRNLGADQVERYQPLFDNSRRLRELVAELEAISVQLVTETDLCGEAK
jgi:hypothetical protein